MSENQLSLIFGRRSVRVFSPGDITESQLTQLLEAAMAAPSAMTKDPWRFIVVRNRSVLQRLAGACPGGSMLSSATMGIVACGDLEAAFEQHIGYLLQDCSASIENLLLAAHGLGLGACWVGAYPSEPTMKQLREILNIPKHVVPVAVIALGIPGEQTQPRTRFKQENVHLESW